MSFNRIAVAFSLAILVATVASAATTQFDVPDYSTLTVKQTTPSVGTVDEFVDVLGSSFAAIDSNNDGKVSYSEALISLPGITQDVFYSVDTNGDGYITSEELEAASGCAGCSCTKGGVQKHFSDLFLGGLSLAMLAAFSRRNK